MSSMVFSDIYGAGFGLGRPPGASAPSGAERSATPVADANAAPAMSWVGMVALLVLVRVLWEYGK